MLAALAVAATLSGSCPERLPEFAPIVKKDIYFENWEEIGEAYRRMYHCAQPRIPDPWTPLPGGGASAIHERGVDNPSRRPVRVPQSFIDKTIAHIEAILASGQARYLFFADFDHNHMHLPRSVFRPRYAAVWNDSTALMEGVLAEPGLECVYHSQEHLRRPKLPPREFFGTFGDVPSVRPLDIDPGFTRGHVTRDTDSVFSIQFKAHPLGAYRLKNGTRFDLSFQEHERQESRRQIGVLIEDGPNSF